MKYAADGTDKYVLTHSMARFTKEHAMRQSKMRAVMKVLHSMDVRIGRRVELGDDGKPVEKEGEIEQSFKEVKNDLGLRPVYHQLDSRIEAHIFVSYVAYCLQATLKNLTRSKASGLTPRQIFDKMKKIYMVDVKIPTTDGREIVMQRYGEPKDDVALVLSQLGLRLPPQPPPKIDGKTIEEAQL